MSARVLTVAIAAFAVSIIANQVKNPVAHAGTVQGTVKPASSYGPPPARSEGFIKRKRNPWRPIRKFSPLPWVVIVLEGPADAKAPPREAAQYPLDGQNFNRPLLAVQTTREVVIKNLRKTTHQIYALENPKLIEAGDIGPGGKRSFVLSKGFTITTLRSKGNVHLLGRLLAVPHAYFAQPTKAGAFTITGVPPGKWRIKVWYRDGWLETKTVTIDVGRGKQKTKVQVDLPQSLSTKSPTAAK